MLLYVPIVESAPSSVPGLECDKAVGCSFSMSVRNGSASNVDCPISKERCIQDDLELTELGPLLEGPGQPAAPKRVASVVSLG